MRNLNSNFHVIRMIAIATVDIIQVGDKRLGFEEFQDAFGRFRAADGIEPSNDDGLRRIPAAETSADGVVRLNGAANETARTEIDAVEHGRLRRRENRVVVELIERTLNAVVVSRRSDFPAEFRAIGEEIFAFA